MATYTLTAADPLLKDLYVPPIIEQLNYKTYMIDQIERDSDSVDMRGRRWISPVHANRNRGRGSRGDNENLPVAGINTDLDAIDKIKYHYYSMEISDPTIEAAKSDAGAFANLLERETNMLAKEMRKDINRQVFGDGTGALTAVAKEEAKGKKIYVNSVQYIGVGDFVDVVLTATGVKTNGVLNTEVTKRVSAAESYIEVADETAEKTLTTYSVYIAGSYKKEMPGLRQIIAKERTLHEINSVTAGNEFWNAKTVDAESAVAGESLFEKLYDEVGVQGNGDVEAWVTTRGIKRNLADTYQSQKRFNDAQAVNVHGGYTAIFVNEIPVIYDDDCPKGFAFGINKDSYRWFQQTSPGWLEQKDGSVMMLKNSTTAGLRMNVWQAYFRWYAALGCTAPNRNGRIEKAKDDLPA